MNEHRTAKKSEKTIPLQVWLVVIARDNPNPKVIGDEVEDISDHTLSPMSVMDISPTMLPHALQSIFVEQDGEARLILGFRETLSEVRSHQRLVA
jgi:hypothetical protein